MTKLFLDMIHGIENCICAALQHAMEKSESRLSGQEVTEWTLQNHTCGIPTQKEKYDIFELEHCRAMKPRL